MPKISIIVPVYNVEKYLPKCLDSLINQTLSDIEIICINDESPDNCAQILQEYANKDSRIIVLNQKNSGQGSARNRGLEVAKGKYIQFLDSDDCYELNCCEEMFNIMERHQDVDVACFGTNIIYETFEDLKENDDAYFKMKWKGKEKVNPQMLLSSSVNCWDKIFRKSFIDEYHLRFPEKLHYEDFAFFWFCMNRAKYMFFYSKKLINYLRRKGSFLGEIFEKSSTTIFDAFEVNELIYNDLIKNDSWDEYKTSFIKAYISKFNWLIKCFSVESWQDKRKVIDKCALFLSKFNIKEFDLDEYEEKTYNLLIKKNYFAFNAYSNYEIDEVKPIYSQNSINIVFSTDKNYIPYLAVAIESIIENSSIDNNYDIIILYQDIYDYQKRFILSLVEHHANVSIRLFNMTEYVKRYLLDKLFTVNHITYSAYFRLFVGRILAEYNKILYLDCDLVINKDIAELFYMDIGEYPIAAALDTIVSNNLSTEGFNADTWDTFKKYMSETLGFFDIEHYFNSGVMIIDIAKFNEFEIEYFADIAQRNNKFFHDQNVMNVAFENNYYLLPPTWNFQWHFKFLSTDYESKLSTDLIELCEDPNLLPAIIHYTSHEKPWKNPCRTFSDIWWQYARNTPFYEVFLCNLSEHQVLSDNYFNLILYRRNKFRYWKYRILSKLTFGKICKKYKQKKKQYKTKIKEAKMYIKVQGRI